MYSSAAKVSDFVGLLWVTKPHYMEWMDHKEFLDFARQQYCGCGEGDTSIGYPSSMWTNEEQESTDTESESLARDTLPPKCKKYACVNTECTSNSTVQHETDLL